MFRGYELVVHLVTPEAEDRFLHIASVTKFVLGTAIAVARHLGVVPDLDEPIADVLTEWQGTDKESITLRHLMTHTSGLAVQWPPSDETEDAIAFALQRDVVAEPGTRWAYDNHGASLIAAILQRATRSRLDEWVFLHLLAPLGVSGYQWNTDSAGNPYAMSALQLTALDLARVGVLWMQRGTGIGRRMFDEDWPRVATSPTIPGGTGVGLLCFFTPGPNGPLTIGHDGSGGQHLWVLPHADVVVSRLRDVGLADDDPLPNLGRELAAIAHACVIGDDATENR